MNTNKPHVRVNGKTCKKSKKFDEKPKCVQTSIQSLDISQDCEQVKNFDSMKLTSHKHIVQSSIGKGRGLWGSPTSYNTKETGFVENTPFDKVLLRGIHLDQPWHEEVANLLARRYQIAGFSRELMINDFAILRNICGDKHPAEVFLPQLEEKVLRGQTQSTRQAYCARIRSIFNSLRMLGVIPINHRPDDGLPKIRTIRAAPRPLSKEQAILLMTQAQYPYNEWFQFACLAGLRAMEVAAISGSWLEHHGEADMLRIYGKGNTELLIPAHPKLSELIKSKHTLSRLYNVKPNHLSRMACQEMRRMGIAVGKQDNSRLSFHSCRHFFATEILQTSGGNLITTQRLMRHQSPVVTARYADVTNNEQRIAMGKLLLDIQWPEFSPPPKLTN